MPEFNIPVAFDITANSEIEAADYIAKMLHDFGVRPDTVDRSPMHPILESWNLPNHPSVDGSDNEAVLVFVSTPSPKTQEVADAVVKAFYDWIDPLVANDPFYRVRQPLEDKS